jgi:hypothetical protein
MELVLICGLARYSTSESVMPSARHVGENINVIYAL